LDLRLVVHEARAESELSDIKTGDGELDKVLGQGYAIGSRPGFRAFTLTFENYLGFSFRAEHYVLVEPENSAQKLSTFSSSKFLDFILGSTFAQDVISEPIIHYVVACEDHVIDVACTTPPLIEVELISETSDH
jgi:hypothetical protein